MGQNRRYGSDLSRAAVAESALRPVPISLTEVQIGAPIKRARAPIKVVVWVPFPGAQVELDGRAVAWTRQAVQVIVEMHAGVKHTVWVWASAVRRTG